MTDILTFFSLQATVFLGFWNHLNYSDTIDDIHSFYLEFFFYSTFL